MGSITLRFFLREDSLFEIFMADSKDFIVKSFYSFICFLIIFEET